MSQVTRLLEVRLHSPADVKIIKELEDARHVVYLEGIAYVSSSSGIYVIPVSGQITPSANRLNKPDLQKILQDWKVSTERTVVQLRKRLNDHVKTRLAEHQEAGIDTNKVILSQNIQPACICSMTDSILICTSDVEKCFYTIELESDGAAMQGSVEELCRYPEECSQIISLCVKSGTMFVAFKGDAMGHTGGLLSVDLTTRLYSVLLLNGTEHCSECAGIATYLNGVLFCDSGSFQVKYLHHDGHVELIAGNGQEGNKEGRAEKSSFGQLMGVCIENEKNVFITDSQTGCIKLITTIAGTVRFLQELGKLYMAFSVHLKHQNVPRLPIPDSVTKVGELKDFLERMVKDVQVMIHSNKITNGPEGTVSNQSLKSVQMIHSELGKLQSTIQGINNNAYVDLHSCLTTQVENLHAVGHFKDECPTVLSYARNLGNSVYESIKRITSWAAYYFTHPTSYYPIPDNCISLQEMPRLPHLKRKTRLDSKQEQLMRDWAMQHGKCVRQRTVRQETTKFKSGNLPLNMYRSSQTAFPREKIVLAQVDPVQEIESEDGREDHDVHKPQDVQQNEYDTDSDTETQVPNRDDIDDDLIFMMGITTRSGRAVQIRLQR